MIGIEVPCEDTIPGNPYVVIDGGFYLHEYIWPKQANYGQIMESQINHIINKYGDDSIVVYDGYDGPPTTKSQEQMRRSLKNSSPDIIFEKPTPSTTSQQSFLANGHNKSQLISGIKSYGLLNTVQATADADVLIVNTALEECKTRECVVVVGSDTDLLCLLIAKAKDGDNVYLLHPGTNTTPMRVYNIQRIRAHLGDKVDIILPMHALSGSDTTSAIYGKGKKTIYKIVMSNPEVQEQLRVFNKEDATHDEIGKAGEKVMISFYHGIKGETLNEKRYHGFKRSVTKKSLSKPLVLASLAPTSNAGTQHSFQTYNAVQEWLEQNKEPTEWGWQWKNGQLVPVCMTQPLAPERILRMVSCNCKTGCNTQQCNCRKFGFKCTQMCGHCSESPCTNHTED